MIRYSLTLRSENRKLGPMATTTASKTHCPKTCPLKKSGCYASAGPMAIHWAKVTDGRRGTTASVHARDLASVPARVMIRLHQAGDFASVSHAEAFAVALRSRGDNAAPAWTYSHHETPDFIQAFQSVNARPGLVVNLSANGLAHADRLADKGSPVVSIVPSNTPITGLTPAGNRYVVCPEQTGKTPNCASCGGGKPLCSRADRRYVIAFRPHGSQQNRVDTIAMEAQ